MSEVIVVHSAGPAQPSPVAPRSLAKADTAGISSRLTAASRAPRVSITLLGLVIAATGLAPAPAQIAEAAEAATCPVPSGMIYNLPKNTVGQGEITADDQFRWHRTMQCMFDAAPTGSKIMITMYSWADQPSADALRAADARGVTVQLIMWDGRISSVDG